MVILIILQIITILLLILLAILLTAIDRDLYLLIGQGIWDSMLREQALKCGLYSPEEYKADLKMSKEFFDKHKDDIEKYFNQETNY